MSKYSGKIYISPVLSLNLTKAILVDGIPADAYTTIAQAYHACFDGKEMHAAAHDFSQEMFWKLPFLGNASYSAFARHNLTAQVAHQRESLARFKKAQRLSDLVSTHELDCTSQCLAIAEVLGEGWEMYLKYSFEGPVPKPTRHAVVAHEQGRDMVIIDPIEGFQQNASWFLEPKDRFFRRYFRPQFMSQAAFRKR